MVVVVGPWTIHGRRGVCERGGCLSGEGVSLHQERVWLSPEEGVAVTRRGCGCHQERVWPSPEGAGMNIYLKEGVWHPPDRRMYIQEQ